MNRTQNAKRRRRVNFVNFRSWRWKQTNLRKIKEKIEIVWRR